MKRFSYIVLCLVTLICISGCEPKQKDSLKFKEEYESINGEIKKYGEKEVTVRSITIKEDNPFVYATAEDIVKKIEKKETFAVYFGFKDCPWCRSVLPELIETLDELKIKKIYYVDVYEIRDTLKVDENGYVVTEKEGSEGYMRLLQLLDSVLADYRLSDEDGNMKETSEKRIYAPNVVSIIDGVPNKLTTGISSLQTDAYGEITDEMKKETKENFTCVLDCLNEEKAYCTDAC